MDNTSAPDALVARAVEQLYTAAIADVLDQIGLREQALSSAIAPLNGTDRLFGRALPVLAEPTDEIGEEPYRKELEAVNALQAGDVLVAVVADDVRCGFWGELLTTAALANSARGAVIDGYTRDSHAIARMAFPVFARGCNPLDSKGRSQVVNWGEPVICGGIRVTRDDYLFGDRDGVVVIPESEIEQVLRLALAKAGEETAMRTALRGGMGVLAAYDRYGIL
jgi:4-hydroxy-4-methyl-2-oxoglutarate aldolase